MNRCSDNCRKSGQSINSTTTLVTAQNADKILPQPRAISLLVRIPFLFLRECSTITCALSSQLMLYSLWVGQRYATNHFAIGLAGGDCVLQDRCGGDHTWIICGNERCCGSCFETPLRRAVLIHTQTHHRLLLRAIHWKLIQSKVYCFDLPFQ